MVKMPGGVVKSSKRPARSVATGVAPIKVQPNDIDPRYSSAACTSRFRSTTCTNRDADSANPAAMSALLRRWASTFGGGTDKLGDRATPSYAVRQSRPSLLEGGCSSTPKAHHERRHPSPAVPRGTASGFAAARWRATLPSCRSPDRRLIRRSSRLRSSSAMATTKASAC